MPKKAWGGIILAAVFVLAALIFFLKPTFTHQPPPDEVTGVWHAEGVNKDGYAWRVTYTFNRGTYDLKTESPFTDQGTYEISKRFEDGSVRMTKTSTKFPQTYDIYITLSKDGKSMVIDGMTLLRQEK